LKPARAAAGLVLAVCLAAIVAETARAQLGDDERARIEAEVDQMRGSRSRGPADRYGDVSVGDARASAPRAGTNDSPAELAAAKKAVVLLNEIRAIDQRLLSAGRKRTALQAEEAAIEKEYESHLADLRQLDEERAEAKALLGRRLASIYKRGRLGSGRVLAQAATSTEPLRMARYLAAISAGDHAAMDAYEKVKEQRRAALAAVDEKKQQIASKREALEREQARWEKARQEKTTLLAKVERENAAIALARRQHRVTEQELDTIISDDAEESRKLDGAAETSALARMYRRAGEPFGKLRGALDPPVKGKVISEFGQRRESGSTVQGLLIRASGDLQVVSVAAGEVVFAGPFPGRGNTMIINHGDRYHTVYAHLSAIAHEVGEKVRDREVLGSLAPSDPTLLFELRAEGKPLDPTPWFHGGYAAFRP
jgi:septal ring factor EnvC (AmiA/AmiB activator)